ncbi:MAG: ABC transporter ATP-binding protein, partial [Burkholderiaceae bacterium]
SPAMNLLDGRLENGSFVGENIRIPGVGKGSHDNVVVGLRWEDLALAPVGSGHMDTEIYTVELIGDATQVTVSNGSQMIVVRTDKTFKAPFGERVALTAQADRAYLFDKASQNRLTQLETRSAQTR